MAWLTSSSKTLSTQLRVGGSNAEGRRRYSVSASRKIIVEAKVYLDYPIRRVDFQNILSKADFQVSAMRNIFNFTRPIHYETKPYFHLRPMDYFAVRQL